ncbi:MAG: hypothetical protein AAF253_11685 [Pseudomonadota bacterium]
MHPAIATLIALSGLAGTAIASPPPSAIYEASPICDAVNVSIYFEPGSPALTPQADAALEGVAESLEGCAISGVETRAIHLASDTKHQRIPLSGQRETSVEAALVQHGLVAGRGTAPNETAPITVASRDIGLPVARRVDVRISAVAPGAVG